MINKSSYLFGASRRSLLKLGAAFGAAALLPGRVRAQSLFSRPDINTAAGARMLGFYAQAVQKMQDLAINIPPQPQSWTFQAYIHGVPADPSSRLNLPVSATALPGWPRASTRSTASPRKERHRPIGRPPRGLASLVSLLFRKDYPVIKRGSRFRASLLERRLTVTVTTLGADRSRGRTYVSIGQVQLLP